MINLYKLIKVKKKKPKVWLFIFYTQKMHLYRVFDLVIYISDKKICSYQCPNLFIYVKLEKLGVLLYTHFSQL